MRDMFDEFLEELRRRQAEAQGRATPSERAPGEAPGAGDEIDEADPAGARTADRGSSPEPAGEWPSGGAPAGRTSGGQPDRGEEPEPIRPLGGRSRGRRGGGGRPPGRGGGLAAPGGRGPGLRTLAPRLLLAAVVVAIFLVMALAGFGVDLWTDAIWFRSVGFEAVFWTRVGTQALMFLGVLVLAVAVLGLNVAIAGRLARRSPGEGGGSFRRWADRLTEASRAAGGGFEGPFDGRYGGPRPRPVGPPPALPDPTPLGRLAITVVAVVIALGLAGAAASHWETFLLWRNQVPFGTNAAAPVTDPVFGRDIGFFLFELPFLRFVQALANGLILGSLVLAAGRYLLAAARDGLVLAPPIRVHLAVLGGLYLLSVAAGYQLDKFELAYSQTGVAAGVSYTDQAARFLALDVLTIVAAVAAAFLVGGAVTGLGWPLAGAVAVWAGAYVVLGVAYPEIVQRFVVGPNPYTNEQPYIANNIAMTRLAYGLDQWTVKDYQGEAPLTRQAVDQESTTFANARLWDYRPLADTLDQLQKVRQYYDFVDVDTDRYQIAGQERQVMLSARELASDQIPNAANWLNERIIYTHGMGLAMVPVNEVADQGQPRLIVRNLPPVSSDGAPTITQPRIYFGERPSDYIITGARQPEFDYPSGGDTPGGTAGEAQVQTRWTGTSGIRLDTTLSRLLFALRFRDFNLLISDQVTDQTQLLFHRSLADRLTLIAPFLSFDKDPYLVVRSDGRLVWVQDAYTTSDRFPHAQPFDASTLPGGSGLATTSFNYIRNSVKIVVDAYDGTTTFYANDPTDPILRAYEGVFPGMFHPLAELPTDLAAHLRTPEELFNVQTRVYGLYHVTDPLVFFQREDVWTIPTAKSSEQTLAPEAYYVVMRMPGEQDAEFLLLQPMIPANRPNMIAWVAARNDGDVRGTTRVYHFPSDTAIFGPAQVEALIDQDPVISAQISLWDQSGSRVIRGNLIVVPVGDSLLYLQPVYLQSTGSSFPAFQRIVVATPQRVVWGASLTDALNQLLAAGPGPSPGPSPSPSPGPSASPGPSPTPGASLPAGDIRALVEYANAHFEAAQAALRTGDFARYGAEMDLVRAALSQLAVLTGGSPAPSVPPSSVAPSP